MGGAAFQAIIFDLDGVLIDSEPLYLRTINEVLREEKVGPMMSGVNHEFIGAPADLTWGALRARFGLPQPALYYQERYYGLLEGVLRRELRIRPDAARLLKEVARRGTRRALATSSRRRWTDLKLHLLGLEGYFGATVCREDVAQPKPAPDVYLRAGEMAGIAMAEAIAVEDSPTGIAAAKAAGLYTVALRTGSTDGMDLGEADRVIESLDGFDWRLLDGRAVHAD